MFFLHLSNDDLLQVWLISCTLFVFLALMEYFIVLFGIRYDKHWRKPKPKAPASTHNLAMATSATAAASANVNAAHTESDVSSYKILNIFNYLTLPLCRKNRHWSRRHVPSVR